MIPVIDIFAGPGGIGEGFSALETKDGKSAFNIQLSIEKDPVAHLTLRLRSFFREFNRQEVPSAYYDLLRGRITQDELFDKHARESEIAKKKAWLATWVWFRREQLESVSTPHWGAPISGFLSAVHHVRPIH